jgi:hypothetical protein
MRPDSHHALWSASVPGVRAASSGTLFEPELLAKCLGVSCAWRPIRGHRRRSPACRAMHDEDLASEQLGIDRALDHEYSRLVLLRSGVPEEAIRLLPEGVENTAEEVRAVATYSRTVVRYAADDPFQPDRWWRNTRDAQAGAGDPELAAKRLALVADCDLLQITDAVERLAALLLARGLVPDTVPNDALHIAVATVGGAEYLLTWNLRHLAGALARRRIEQELRRLGHEPPTICTPEELMP